MSGKPWKVTYFNGRGRAESTRIVLTEAGVPFEDIRINKEKWDAMKESTPTHTLPILETDEGIVLSQSSAILRYLGRRFGMYNGDVMEEYRIDLVMNIIDDLVDKILIPALFEKDPLIKAEKMKKVEGEDLTGYLKLLSRELQAGGHGFFVGTELTIADVKVFTVLENMTSDFPETMAKWDDLREFKERIASRPKIAEWIKKRPNTWF
ncbi:glutathione S-transferase 1-like [Ylistrum balloti]|uniref:glutathione S-transferase 1-like n=1 Tax=Ylistrum balloti TaxID=509963 RepID=UPI002905E09A|nr:glutathione S-transferase 1-like [Ylistrum balloti]